MRVLLLVIGAFLFLLEPGRWQPKVAFYAFVFHRSYFSLNQLLLAQQALIWPSCLPCVEFQVSNFKGHKKGAAIYVQSITTVHNLCSAFTLWLKNFTVILLLFSCHTIFKTATKKKKDFSELQNQFLPLNVVCFLEVLKNFASMIHSRRVAESCCYIQIFRKIKLINS